MIDISLTQEEIEIIERLWEYLVYLGYSPTENELILVASIRAKLEEN